MDTATLSRQRCVSITTFKRDGTPVATPVWVAAEDGTLLVWSEAESWKVKRIRRDPHVRVAPCNARGTVRGEAIDADATISDDIATVGALLAHKYGWTYRAYRLFSATTQKLRRREPPRSVTIRIVPRYEQAADSVGASPSP